MLLGPAAVARWVADASVEFASRAKELDALDAAIGDGDHGSNLARGMATAATIPLGATQSAADYLGRVGMALVSSVGGASGPLYGTFFLKTGQLWTSPPSVTSLALALRAGLKSIQARGRAEVGDATMIDALAPAVDVLEGHRSDDVRAAVTEAIAASLAGAETTAKMVARRGRAAHYGQASVGHVDPGARSMALLIESAGRQVIGTLGDPK